MPGATDEKHRRPRPSDGKYHKWGVALPSYDREVIIEHVEGSPFLWFNGDQRSKLRYASDGSSFAQVGGKRIDIRVKKSFLVGRRVYSLEVEGCAVEEVGANGSDENLREMSEGSYTINTSPKRGAGNNNRKDNGKQGGSAVGWHFNEEEKNDEEVAGRVKEDDFDDELDDEEEEDDGDSDEEEEEEKSSNDDRRPPKTTMTMPRGVEKLGENHFTASIKTPQSKFLNLGTFDTVQEAQQAYESARDRFSRK